MLSSLHPPPCVHVLLLLRYYATRRNQVFEKWLLDHGARFPKLTMQKYDDEVG